MTPYTALTIDTRGYTKAGEQFHYVLSSSDKPIAVEDNLRREFGLDLQLYEGNQTALLLTDYLSGGTNLTAGIEMRVLLEDTNWRCPRAVHVTGSPHNFRGTKLRS